VAAEKHVRDRARHGAADRAATGRPVRPADAGKLKVHAAGTFPPGEAGAAHGFLAKCPIGMVVPAP
jgi:hypothetical protein